MFGSAMQKCSKRLASLYEDKKECDERYQELIEKYECESCENYNQGNVKALVERFGKCADCKHQEKILEIAERIERLSSDIDAFIEDEYAKAVFDKYNKEKPVLKHRRGGEKVAWDEAFGDDFKKITKSLRHSLVGLVEGEGRYML